VLSIPVFRKSSEGEKYQMKFQQPRWHLGWWLLLVLAIPAGVSAQTNPNTQLVEAAKKEGEVVYYTTMTLDQSKMVADRFEKKYGIRVTLFRTGGGPLLNKIFTESRGGRHDWDVVVGRARWCCR
jgi:ABC-type thiamine transport system substrate-binding protein